MRNLDITTLRALVAVSDHGGVTRAAAALNLTQSAVSMQLKRLEEMLGLPLLDRSSRRVAFTASGEQLLSYARRMVQMNDEVVGRLTDTVYQGKIVLGVPHDIIYPVVPRVLKAFSAACPRVRVHLRSSNTLRLKEALNKGEVDLILTTEAELHEGGETLTEVPLRWTGAVSGQAWKRRPLRLAFGQVCVFRPIALRKTEEAGIEWELTVESEDYRAGEALVSADLAVTAMLEDSIPAHLEAIPPGTDLPDLGQQKINMYGTTPARDKVVHELAEILRGGFGALRRPLALVSAS